MSAVNTVVFLVAGPFADAVSAIWTGSRFSDFLSASDRRRQIWYACLSANSCTFSPDCNDVDLLYARLTSWRAKDLIVQAFGSRPRGALSVIGRLGSRARDPETYQMLLEIMDRGGPG